MSSQKDKKCQDLDDLIIYERSSTTGRPDWIDGYPIEGFTYMMLGVSKNSLILATLISLTAAPPLVQASVELGTDIFVSLFPSDLHIRTRNQFSFSIGKVRAGALARFEPQHDYLTDYTAGAMVGFGDRWEKAKQKCLYPTQLRPARGEEPL